MKRLLILNFFLCFVAKSYSCECSFGRTLKENIENSSLVVMGTIISQKIDTIFYKDFEELAHPDSTKDQIIKYQLVDYLSLFASYEMVVWQLFKGEIKSDTVTICSAVAGGGDCGYRFEIGEKYIVVGDTESYLSLSDDKFSYPKGENILWTSICDFTSLYSSEFAEEVQGALK